jgi:hypothetical protein
MVTEAREKELLDHFGAMMADNLSHYAADHNLDLRPLFDTGYGWFDWLTITLGDDVRNKVFWNLSHSYAVELVEPIGAHIQETYSARRWQVGQHAIHLLGRHLFPPEHVRWEAEGRAFSSGGVSYWIRSWPCVQRYAYDDLLHHPQPATKQWVAQLVVCFVGRTFDRVRLAGIR